MEVNHGPSLVDHNLFLSARPLNNWSQGGAYVHNLFAGQITIGAVIKRCTPYHTAHSTELAGSSNIEGGDERFYNNLFIDVDSFKGHLTPSRPCGLGQEKDGQIAGNAYTTFTGGNAWLSDWSGIQIDETRLILNAGRARQSLDTTPPVIISSETLGKATLSGLPYLNTDGREIRFDTDFFGKPHNSSSPEAGPFSEGLGSSFELPLNLNTATM